MDTFFLIDRGEGMPRWCVLSEDRNGAPAWIDAKGRVWPKDTGRPLAHVVGDRWDCTVTDVPKVVADLERDLAQRHLLDPWSNQGWISPTGRFYGCSFFAHDDIAHAMLRKPVHALEAERWVRVHDDSYSAGGTWNGGRPNRLQQAVLQHLGFDLDAFRRGPYAADRSGPAPAFSVKPRAGLEPARPADPPAEPPFTQALLKSLLDRLRQGEPTGFLFDGEEPDLVTDLGGGNWEWLLFFPVSGMNLGSGETMRDLLSAEGIHLRATASDQVEMTAWHEPGFSVSRCAADALEATRRHAPAL